MRYAQWIGLAGTSVVLAILLRGQRPHAATAPARSELTPDPAIVHYRFAPAAAPDPDLDGMIVQLEARLEESYATELDMTDLADLYYRRASKAGDLEDYARSEAMARRSLARMPSPNAAGVILAKVANAQHRFREASELVQTQLARRPTAGMYLVMATARLALGDLEEAATSSDAAIKLVPSSSGYLMRALARQAQGRDADAAADFARAATVEDAGQPEESARLRTLWGRFLLRRGDLAGAAALFEEALRIAPEYPLARAQHAELALRTGRHREARTMFEQAFASSRQVRYLIDLARAQELAGDRVAASASRVQVEKMVRAELASHGFGHQLDLVEILVDRGTRADLAEAIPLAREEVVRRPTADTRFQLARALFRAGARDEALVEIRTALATGARDARLFELGSRLEDGPRAAELAREADKLDPGRSGWRELGM